MSFHLVTYSTQPEIAKDTSAPTAHYTPVLDLRETRVAVHLCELQLGLGTHTLRVRGIADDVAERLSVWQWPSASMNLRRGIWARIPFRLEFSIDFPLRMVANIADVDKASDVKLLRVELRHGDDGCGFCWMDGELLMDSDCGEVGRDGSGSSLSGAVAGALFPLNARPRVILATTLRGPS